MLEMRPDCEGCGADLPAEAPGAFICSFECTFAPSVPMRSTIVARIAAAS